MLEYFPASAIFRAVQFFGRQFCSLLCCSLLSGGLSFAQEVKEIPIEQTPPRAGAGLQITGSGLSVTVDPSASASRVPVEGGVSESLQQQMRIAIEQALAPTVAIVYRAEAGFKSVDTELLGQEELSAAYFNMLQRPALLWRPREGTEFEVAHENVTNLNQDLAAEDLEAVAVRAKVKMSAQTTLNLTARAEEKKGYGGEQTSQTNFQAPVEHAIANTPLKLVIGPGYQTSVAPDGSQAIRAFVEQSLIWQVDDWTALTFGSNTAPLFFSDLSDSSSYFLMLQHKVLPVAAIEVKAALLQSQTALVSDSWVLSAQSTVALAEALSAGLGVRYKMDQNPLFNRPNGETFLTLSINGRF